MYTCLLVLGAVLAGQVGAADSRYDRPPAEGGNYNPPASQPAVRSQPPATPRSKPSDLYRKLLSPPISHPLSGNTTRLADVVRGASSRGEQTRRVEAYWDLSAAVTDYHLSLLELTEFDTLRASVSRPSAYWEEAKRRVHVSEHSAMAAQYRLSALMGQSDSTRLPIPSDLPHCGAYDTRYDQIFGNRSSRHAKELHELLPQRHRDLQRQAEGVAAARNWFDAVSLHRGSQADGTGLLKAHELLILRRRAFVYTVRDYNLQIARYSELASPGNVGSNRLVSMLIHTTSTPRGAWQPPEIQRTSAIEELRNPPRTFAPGTDERSSQDFQSGGSRAEHHKINPNGERSIVVP